MKYFYTKFMRIMPQGIIIKSIVIIFMIGFATIRVHAQSGLCDTGVPFYNVDLTGSPSSTYTSPTGSRANNCCGTSSPDRCVEFEIMLHPGSTGIMFDIYTGAVPPGAMFYQINCGPEIPVGQSVCLSGQGPHTVTFCKPGNNPNSYIIKSIPAAYSIQDAVTRIGCSVNLKGEGLDASTVIWRDITGNGIYDNLLSCTIGCNEALFTPVMGMPSTIEYEVCGSVLDTICNNYYLVCDTVTVTIFPEINITLPSLSKYCSTSAGININPIVSGGNGIYSYTWRDSLGNVISNSSTYFASKGTYTLSVADGFIDCPPARINFTVEEDLPAVVEAGVSQLICSGQTEIQLNGNIQLAPSGVWSGGTGVLNYPNSELINTYSITQQDSINGYVQFILRSVGDTVCPAVRDTVTFTISTPLVIQPSVTQISCNATNDGAVSFSVSGGTPNYWYSIDSINFQSSNSFNNLSDGSYRLWARDTAGCIASTSIVIVPPMTMNANLSVNSPVCVGNNIQLNALTNGATNYTWSGPNSFSANINNPLINSATTIQSGIYRVTITNGYCTITESIAVNVLPAPIANAGRDTSVCGGNIVTIGGIPSATGGSLPYTYNWLPTTGLSNSNIANPAVIVTQTLNYTLTVTDANGCSTNDIVEVILGRCNEICTSAKGPNILGAIGSFSTPYMVPNTTANICLRNGLNTFSQINNIALPKPTQTTYTYTSANGGLFPEGRYTFIKNLGDQTGASCLHSRFHAVDHTGDGGYFMAVNGSPNLALYGNTFFRLDSIPVCPNTNYEFSAFVTNILSGLYNQPSFQFPNISFYINNIIVATSGPIPNNPGQVLNDWIKAGGVWNSGSANYASIRIDNATVIATGNDLGIDDIVFSVCGPIIIDDNPNRSLCVGETFSITQTINSTGTTNYSFYKWQVSANNGNTWSDASGIMNESQSPTLYNAVLGPLTAALNMNGNLYRILVANDSLSLATGNSFCYAIGPPSAISVRPSPTAFAGTDKIICIGDSVIIGGSIAATGGTAPYQYQWNNAGSLSNSSVERPVAEPNTTTTYRLSVTDATGCVATDEVVVTVSNPQIVNAIVNNITCYGNNNGSINITLNGGISPYSFNWSNNSIAEDQTNLSAGNYTVSISDAIGCTAVGTYSITEPAPLTISNNKTDVTCFGGNNGSINITISGGTLPYTFNWNDGYILRDRTNLVAGNYSVTATDANGCSIANNITIEQPGEIIVTENITHVSCFSRNDGSINMTISGGSAPYSFNWSHNSNNQNAENLYAGTYTVTITDNNNCTLQETYSIVQPDSIIIDADITNISCNGFNNGAIDINVSGGVGPYSFNWSNNSIAEDQTNLSAGNYTVSINDAIGCTAVGTYSITEPAPLTISNNKTDVTCFGGNNGTININISGGTLPYTFNWSDGYILRDRANLVAGNYTLTATDANGCSTTTNATIEQPNALQITGITKNITCYNGNDGNIDITITGGVAPYSYNWSNGTTNQNAENLSAGIYFVTITDNNNCNSEASFNLSQPTELSITLSTTNATCYGYNDGSIVATATGGTTPYTFEWNTLSNQNNIQNLIAGNYSLTITDNKGCVTTASTIVAQPDSINISATIQNVLCYGNNDGIITTYATGGTSPYTYQWSNNWNFELNRHLYEGYYTVTVTDHNNCIKTETYYVSQPDELQIALTGTPLICIDANSGAVAATISGGTPNYTYQWSNGSTTGNLNNLTKGTYVVTVRDANSCLASLSYTINEYNYTAAIELSDNEICAGENITFNLNTVSDTAITAILWIFSDNTISIQQTVNKTFTTSGNHAAAVSVLFENGCLANTQTPVIVNALPAVDAGENKNICPGNNVTLEASGAISYSWSSAAPFISVSNSTIRTAPTENATYYVSGVDINGCSNTDSVQVFIHEILPLQISNDTLLCNGSSTVLQATGAVSYEWYPAEYLSCDTCSSTTALTNTTTVFRVNATDINGCPVSDSVRVTIVPMPIGILNNTLTTCENNEVILRAFPEANTTYHWQPDSLFSNANSNSVTVNPSQTTTYILSSTTSFGCNKVDTITVVVLEKPEINISDTISYCKGNSYSVNLDSTLQYLWQPSTGLSCNNCSNPVLQSDSSMNYIITISTADGCSFTDSIQLNVFELPLVSLSVNRKICNGETVNIIAEAATATGIVWSPTNGLNNSSSRIVQASPDTTTRYMVQVSDSNGCINQDSILVEVFNKVQFNLDSLMSICRGESVVLVPTITTANNAHIHFQWLPENAFNNAHADSQQLTPDYSAGYQLIISSGACIPDTQSFYINVHQGPTVVLNAPEYVIAGSNFEVTANATGATIYNWQYDTVSISNHESSIVAAITQPTLFAVNVVNEHHCSATQYKMVKVIDQCGDAIFIPNAFTPNGDEINDKLCIRSLELQAIKIFRVFNRWGELVFETTDINHCWDGYFKGKVVNPDVYVYYAEGICTNGQSKLMKGNVTVVR